MEKLEGTIIFFKRVLCSATIALKIICTNISHIYSFCTGETEN